MKQVGWGTSITGIIRVNDHLLNLLLSSSLIMNDKQFNLELKEALEVAVDSVRHQAPAGVATLTNLNCNTTNLCSLGTSSWRSTSCLW